MTSIEASDYSRRVDFSAKQALLEIIAGTQTGSGGQFVAWKKRYGFINRPLIFKQLRGHRIGRSLANLVDLDLALVVPEDTGIL